MQILIIVIYLVSFNFNNLLPNTKLIRYDNKVKLRTNIYKNTNIIKSNNTFNKTIKLK